MRRGNGDETAANNALATISAAANAIAAAENRAPQARAQKRGWRSSLWSLYWCFGSHNKHRNQIEPAVSISETSPESNTPTTENPTQAPTISLPFIAPPSSPASFLQSDPPSATQSPTGLLPHTSISSSMYSPPGPTSIFAIGPYAYETQLVSPPVFSTFTTEPSTAPFTPPESLHLNTTPSSPEVPFAQLLKPNIPNGESSQQYPFLQNEFHSYNLYPGSPVSHLISPRSGISESGTSSPFREYEFLARGGNFLKYPQGEQPPKLLNLDILSAHDWGSRLGSGSLTPVSVSSKSNNGGGKDEVVDNGFTFKLIPEDVIKCVEKKPVELIKAVAGSLRDSMDTDKREEDGESVDCYKGHDGEPSKGEPGVAQNKFNFDNSEGDSPNPHTVSENWSFFPMMQPGVS